MAATEVSVQSIVRTGLDRSLAAANADGNYFQNTGREFLAVDNGGAGAITVTVVTPYSTDGLALEDRTISVGASKVFFIGPFPKTLYNDENDRVNITYSDVTSVTVGVFRL